MLSKCNAYRYAPVAQLTLPKRKLEDLYEQVVLEMIVGLITGRG